MKIIFDFDGVIYNTPLALVKLYNELYNDNVTIEVCRKWNLSGACHITSNECVEVMFENPELYKDKDITEGSIELLQKLGNSAMIATIGRWRNIYNKCENILYKHLPDIKTIGIIKRNPKHTIKDCINMKGCIFIDDKMYNLIGSDAKYKILFDTIDAEWNIGWEGIKVTTMSELELVIEAIILTELSNKYKNTDIYSEIDDDGFFVLSGLYSTTTTKLTLQEAIERI